VELLTFTHGLLEIVRQPWHWAVAGTAIAGIVFLMTWMGQSFGVSTAFRDFCTLAGAGKRHEFFNIDLKAEDWRFAFVGGAVFGGFIGAYLLGNSAPIDLSAATVAHLQQDFQISPTEGNGFLPTGIFNFSNPKGIFLAIVGGFLVGFGARYGRGCTSGHAITGLSHLQLPSLITVIGFFIGGLIMTWLIMPVIL